MAQAQIDAMPLKDREHIRALRRGAKSKRQQGKALWAEQKLKREHEAAAPSASLAGSAGAIASAVAGAAASNVAAVNAVRAAAPPPIGAGAAAAAAAVARAVAPPPPVAPPESIDVEVPKGLESGQYFRVQARGARIEHPPPPTHTHTSPHLTSPHLICYPCLALSHPCTLTSHPARGGRGELRGVLAQ